MTKTDQLKPAVPFHLLDLDSGWEQVPGGAEGVEQKMLSGALDEDAKLGVRTRLIRFRAGTVAATTFLHDYWEEVLLLKGTLVTGCDAEGKGGESFTGPCYACRPPGTPHGPFHSPDGCIFFEIQYYAKE
jgi:hypothetical protein